MSQVLYTKRTYRTDQILWLVNKTTLPILLIGWLYVRGVSIENSISLSIVISIQLLTGLYTWKLLNRESTGLTPESLGMGLAIGSALATVSDQVFLITPLKPIAWVIPSVVIATVAVRPQRFNLNSTSRAEDFRWFFFHGSFSYSRNREIPKWLWICLANGRLGLSLLAIKTTSTSDFCIFCHVSRCVSHSAIFPAYA